MSGATVDLYVIWSHEHGRWWGPGGCGYETRLAQAGRYTREQALHICRIAVPGAAYRMSALPELPVRLADVEEFVAAYEAFNGANTARDQWR
ncbi:MAG TPA: hypothetical protein VGI78_06690 [Acetobacteraceae bacterium]|jgi:hypothetical protein